MLPPRAAGSKTVTMKMAAGAKPAVIWRKEMYSPGVTTQLVPQGRVYQLFGLTLFWTPQEDPCFYCRASPQSDEWVLLMVLTYYKTLSYFTQFQFTLIRRASWEAHAGSSPDKFAEAYWRQFVFDPFLRRDLPAEEEESAFGSYQTEAQDIVGSDDMRSTMQDLQDSCNSNVGI
eukprot:523820-Amphidinium_carterae.2